MLLCAALCDALRDILHCTCAQFTGMEAHARRVRAHTRPHMLLLPVAAVAVLLLPPPPHVHAQPSFLPHYLQIASRKILLFHGRRVMMQPRHGGSSDCAASSKGSCAGSSGGRLVVRIADLVGSPVMAELQELLLLGPGAEQERDMFSNWFSLQVLVISLHCLHSYSMHSHKPPARQAAASCHAGSQTHTRTTAAAASAPAAHACPCRALSACWQPSRRGTMTAAAPSAARSSARSAR